MDQELSARDRINRYFRSRGKSQITDADRKMITRAEQTQEILMANRTDMTVAKQKIKSKFALKHREEIDRCIEDARFLMGASFVVDRAYQRLIQHQDIEFWLEVAKTNKDGDLAEKMLLRREKLYQLDQADEQQQFNYFNIIVIQAEVKYFIDADDKKEAEKIKRNAMKQLNMIEDIDAEFTT